MKYLLQGFLDLAAKVSFFLCLQEEKSSLLLLRVATPGVNMIWNFSNRQSLHALLVVLYPDSRFSSKSQVMLKLVPDLLRLWTCLLRVVPVNYELKLK